MNRKRRTNRATNAFCRLARLRECVVRDLAWLLNTECMASVQKIEDYPDAQAVGNQLWHSVADGRQFFGNRWRSAWNWPLLEAIHTFEPRLIRGTVSVKERPRRRRNEH